MGESDFQWYDRHFRERDGTPRTTWGNDDDSDDEPVTFPLRPKEKASEPTAKPQPVIRRRRRPGNDPLAGDA